MAGRSRWRSTIFGGLLAALLLTGCTLPKPPGDGAVRYRDQTFAAATKTADVTYGSAIGRNGTPETLKLDLYAPTGDTVQQRPAIVFVHGGGFTSGDKAAGAGFATDFARRGFVVVSINYRLFLDQGCGGERVPRPECEAAATSAQHDAQAAVRFLRANASTYRIDPNRVAVAGSSAGAVTSLLVDWQSEDPGDSGNPGPSSRVDAAVSISGGIPTNDPIEASDPPAIFFHGTADPVVFYDWAVQNAAAMSNLGIFTVLEPFEGAKHGLERDPAVKATIYAQTSYFLYYAMDLGRAQGQSAAARRAAPAYERRMARFR